MAEKWNEMSSSKQICLTHSSNEGLLKYNQLNWPLNYNLECGLLLELLTKWKQKQMQESSNKISIYLKPNTTQALHQIKALDIKQCNMITAKTLITDSWQRYRALSSQGNKDSRIIFYSRFADSPCMEGQTGKIYGRDCIAIWKLYNYHQLWL